MAKSKGRLLSELVESPKNEDYADVNSLPDTGNKVGDQAFVEETNRLYIWNGTGWYNIALINTAPSITSSHDSSYNLLYNTPLNISVAATDPEGLNLTYSYNTSDSIGNVATITNDSSQFTITPSNNYAVEGSFSVAFRASDGVNIATAGTSTFTLANQAPSLSGNSASYQLASDGSTATVITLVAVDPEGQPITYSATGDSGFNAIATVANDSSVFTITPKNSTQAPGGGTGNLTFTASDGLKSTNAASSFTLTFMADWSSATQQAKLAASDAAAGDRFGNSVSISEDGNTAIVGAHLEDTAADNDAGSAYIFARSGTSWSQQAKIQASNAGSGDYFGFSVSISNDGNTAIVGAYFEDSVSAYNTGAAYIFTRSGTSWSQQAMIQASDAQQNDYFGKSVSISGDGNTVIVGANLSGTQSQGAAYIFTRSGSTWSQQTKLTTPFPSWEYARFGNSVSISEDGNTAIVGAVKEGSQVNTYDDAGAAYIFTRSGTSWSQQAKILSSDRQSNDEFGYSVSISNDGNTAIVSAPTEDTGLNNKGSAYIFTRSGTSWSQEAKIQTSDSNTQSFGKFGEGVSISEDGNIVLVGHTGYEQSARNDEGAVHIFTRSGTTWTEQATIQASDRESNDNFGLSVSISADGETAIAGGHLEDTGGTDAGAAYIFVAS